MRSLVVFLAVIFSLAVSAQPIDYATFAQELKSKSREKLSWTQVSPLLIQLVMNPKVSKEEIGEAAKQVQELSPSGETEFDQKRFKTFGTALLSISINDPTREELVKELREIEKKKKPAYKGYDHQFASRAHAIALYAKRMAESVKDSQAKAAWYFLAAEATFSFSKTGIEEYKKFLTYHSSSDDKLALQAKAKIKRIEALNEGSNPYVPKEN